MTTDAPQSDPSRTDEDRVDSRQDVDLARFVALLVPLALIVLVVFRYQLENQAFLQIVMLAVGGFLVHYFLPYRYRLRFFLFLSLGGIAFILGPELGAWLVGIGLVLIGICHLPIPYWARVAIIVLVTGLLAAMRGGFIPVPWSVGIWPVLASIFMFRLAIYLYEIRHEKTPAPLSQRLSYFFLLPNPVFPLFPVVDYATFRQSYYANDDRHDIYAVGVTWIVRGIVHLILYRLIYYHILIPAAHVQDLGDVFRYVSSGYLAYLRISGQFHVIVGILHLFGFNLPRTNRNYFLATSFTDFWRRINIYWKNFMTKLFFNPIFMRLRHIGTMRALVIATLVTLVISWLLHSYQWFWLRGNFPVTVQDGVFWGLLGVFMAANAVYETKYGRKRSLSQPKVTIGTIGLRALKAALMFTFISVLWSFWTAEDIPVWLEMWQAAGNVNFNNQFLLLVIGGAILFFGAIAYTTFRERPQTKELTFGYGGSLATGAVVLAAFAFLSVPGFYNQLGPSVGTVVNNLRSTKLNRLDTHRMERGYYENLLAVDMFNSKLWEIYMNRPVDWLEQQVVGSARPTGDFLLRELIPLSEFYGSRVLVHVNSWGMRDKEYERTPPSDTYRIAIMGTSYVMGQGVEQDKIFESLLEDRLNSERPDRRFANYEILNFGASGYKPLQQLWLLEQKVLAFEPRTVLYVAHAGDMNLAARHLVEAVRAGVEIPYPYLRDLVARENIDRSTPDAVAIRRLTPYHEEMIGWLYESFVEVCRQKGVTPVWVFLPAMKGDLRAEQLPALKRLADESDFVIVDLSDVYGDYDSPDITLAEWDYHPNELGHRLISDLMYKLIVDDAAASGPIFVQSQPAIQEQNTEK